jgi:putative esterase
MNVKENLLYMANFTILIIITMAILSGCKKDDICSETTWYQDADGDGLGNPAISIMECDQPSGYVNNNDDDDDTPGPYDQYINTEINSSFIGETYPLNIFLPAGYETKNLPVLYLLDGKYYFEDVIKYTREIEFEVIIVGIGDHFFKEEFDLRRRDFLPGVTYNGVMGGHLNFYKFLTQEVVPYIDQNYENDRDSRSLIGHHAAGLFTNFSLLNEAPENSLFYGFLSINAEILNQSILVDMADSLVFSPDAGTIKLHISQVSSTLKGEWFYQLFEDIAFPWLSFDLFTVEDTSTAAFNPVVVEPSIKDGLKFIYSL